jgi:hypothetical protein
VLEVFAHAGHGVDVCERYYARTARATTRRGARVELEVGLATVLASGFCERPPIDHLCADTGAALA